MHYVAAIDKDPGGAYGIQFPEVPGCYSAADSFDDIVPNAIEACACSSRMASRCLPATSKRACDPA